MSHLLTDHLGRQVNTVHSPKRIISICPAITETLFALGLENEIVGRTKYCIFPKGIVENVRVVGGTKEVNVEKIRELQPDLILAEKEENTEEIVHALEKIAPVFVLEVQSIKDAYRFIQTLGFLTNKEQKAEHIIYLQIIFPFSTSTEWKCCLCYLEKTIYGCRWNYLYK